MSASLKTRLQAAQYDALRLTEGVEGSLTLYKTTTAGYELLATILKGWLGERETDSFNGAEYMVARVAVTDDNDPILTDTVTDYVSAVGFLGRRFAVQQRGMPFGDPSEWVFRCDPTGEPL